jgi:hypothetical protein
MIHESPPLVPGPFSGLTDARREQIQDLQSIIREAGLPVDHETFADWLLDQIEDAGWRLVDRHQVEPWSGPVDQWDDKPVEAG